MQTTRFVASPASLGTVVPEFLRLALLTVLEAWTGSLSLLRVQTAAHSECVTVQICRKLSFINLFQFENDLSVNGKAAFKHKVNTILRYIYISEGYPLAGSFRSPVWFWSRVIHDEIIHSFIL